MVADPIPALSQAIGVVSQVVGAVGEGDWQRTTPCPEWTVRELVAHMTEGNERIAARLVGRADTSPANGGNTDPRDAYRRSAERLLEAVGSPGALKGSVALSGPGGTPIGDIPASVAVQMRTVDNLVHGWDLAVALGRPLACPDALAATALEMTEAIRSCLPPFPAGMAPPFGPPVPVGPDSPPIDRLVAMLGRRPPSARSSS